MQLDDYSNQQNGNYQLNPEPGPAVGLILSPPALVEPQQQVSAAASDRTYIQEGVQQHRLHPGTYQQADAQRQPYQPQTVSHTFTF